MSLSKVVWASAQARESNWAKAQATFFLVLCLAAPAFAEPVEKDGTTALHWPAYHDDAEAVETLLASGAKAETPNRYGITPLLLACENGNETIVRALL
ncbi:MAG: ankyrin repeat domain-containing protein, partial [Verrucomicrobiales bacterium]|nr:ankyrin repeat domain-containing protein [Verrucomicrobiales bacterium]